MVTENGDSAPKTEPENAIMSALLRKREPEKEAANGRNAGPKIPKAPVTIQDTGLSTSFPDGLDAEVFHSLETPRQTPVPGHVPSKRYHPASSWTA
jgi:hypothetical protein